MKLKPLLLLVGWVNFSVEDASAVLKDTSNTFELRMEKAGLNAGGIYRPKECQSRNKVAIVIPFRKRKDHLKIFLNYMHQFLQRQQLNYIVIVVEQTGQ